MTMKQAIAAFMLAGLSLSTPDPFPSVDCVISTNGTTTYAHDAVTGASVASGSASQVLQAVVGLMPSGGRIHFKAGRYFIDDPLVLPYDRSWRLEGDGAGSRPYTGSSGVHIVLRREGFVRLSAAGELQADRSPHHAFENLNLSLAVAEALPSTIVFDLSTYSVNLLRNVRMRSGDKTPDPASIGVRIGSATDNSGSGHSLEGVSITGFGTCLFLDTSHAVVRELTAWDYERHGVLVTGYNNAFENVRLGGTVALPPASERVGFKAFNSYTLRSTQNRIRGVFLASPLAHDTEYLFEAGGGYLHVENVSLEPDHRVDARLRSNFAKKTPYGGVAVRDLWYTRQFRCEGRVGGAGGGNPGPIELLRTPNGPASFNGGLPLLASMAVCRIRLDAGTVSLASVPAHGYHAFLLGGTECRPLRAFVERVTRTGADGVERIADDLPVVVRAADNSKSVWGRKGVDREFQVLVTPLAAVAEARDVIVRIEFE